MKYSSVLRSKLVFSKSLPLLNKEWNPDIHLPCLNSLRTELNKIPQRMFMPSKRLISENVPCTCKIKKKKRSESLLLCGIDCTNKPWQKKTAT